MPARKFKYVNEAGETAEITVVGSDKEIAHSVAKRVNVVETDPPMVEIAAYDAWMIHAAIAGSDRGFVSEVVSELVDRAVLCLGAPIPKDGDQDTKSASWTRAFLDAVADTINRLQGDSRSAKAARDVVFESLTKVSVADRGALKAEAKRRAEERLETGDRIILADGRSDYDPEMSSGAFRLTIVFVGDHDDSLDEQLRKAFDDVLAGLKENRNAKKKVLN